MQSMQFTGYVIVVTPQRSSNLRYCPQTVFSPDFSVWVQDYLYT